jgi:hypothetical protein
VTQDLVAEIIHATSHSTAVTYADLTHSNSLRMSQCRDFIYLWAVYHNMRPFGRGSVREGHSPAELADIKVPTTNWIELLELVKAYLESPPFTPFEALLN